MDLRLWSFGWMGGRWEEGGGGFGGFWRHNLSFFFPPLSLLRLIIGA